RQRWRRRFCGYARRVYRNNGDGCALRADWRREAYSRRRSLGIRCRISGLPPPRERVITRRAECLLCATVTAGLALLGQWLAVAVRYNGDWSALFYTGSYCK